MAGEYPRDHWRSKIRDYADKGWAAKPSPFALIVQKYLPTKATILELGTGAGQDAIWFASEGHTVVATDASDDYFSKIKQNATDALLSDIDLQVLDVSKKFDLEDDYFDAVYAHLVLHYFDDSEMTSIIEEIKRVLKPGGILAIMVNTTVDPEYDQSLAKDGLMIIKGLPKRFFSTGSLAPLVGDFETLLLDNKGRTAKDDAVGNSGMIQFIGRNHG